MVKYQIDEWVSNNQELAKTNPDLYNSKYADTVLNYFDATKSDIDMFDAIDNAIASGNPADVVAAGIL